jgi:hypothetical protein
MTIVAGIFRCRAEYARSKMLRLKAESALEDHLSGNPYHQYASQSTSETLAPHEETGCPPEPYTLGPSEVVYYCCNCGDGPINWSTTPFCGEERNYAQSNYDPRAGSTNILG